uniref:Uncharacterized protein n=1 Tax=Arundo donax TaxID=35708 RepID=A0A0A9EP85_ARUDO
MKNSKNPGKRSHLNCIENCRSNHQTNLGVLKREMWKDSSKISRSSGSTMLAMPCSFSTLKLSTLSL